MSTHIACSDEVARTTRCASTQLGGTRSRWNRTGACLSGQAMLAKEQMSHQRELLVAADVISVELDCTECQAYTTLPGTVGT